MLAAMSEFLTRDGTTIAYTDSGPATGSDDRALVVLPGWSQSAAQFDRAAALLAPEVRVVAVDHRNHGRSGRSEGGSRVATLAADLAELVDHLELTSFHALGHSMGASVLWSYIDSHGTGRLASTVLLDQPSVCAILPWLDEAQAAQAGAIVDYAGAGAFVGSLLTDGADEGRAAFLTSMLSPDLGQADRDWLLEQNMLLPMPYGARLLNDHIQQDWRDVLPRIDVPTLVVGGEVSHVSPASQEWIASQVPGARLRVFTREEGGSHFPFFEAPEVFVGELRSFLAGVG
jgi:pimeloyl-ACP methyl ester carboxylesterase